MLDPLYNQSAFFNKSWLNYAANMAVEDLFSSLVCIIERFALCKGGIGSFNIHIWVWFGYLIG